MPTAKENKVESIDSFEDLFAEAEKSNGYWAELAKLDFTRLVSERMEKKGLLKKDLASLLDVSASQVTKILSGENNFEIETMVKIARALGANLKLSFEPIDPVEFVFEFSASKFTAPNVVIFKHVEPDPDQRRFIASVGHRKKTLSTNERDNVFAKATASECGIVEWVSYGSKIRLQDKSNPA